MDSHSFPGQGSTGRWKSVPTALGRCASQDQLLGTTAPKGWAGTGTATQGVGGRLLSLEVLQTHGDVALRDVGSGHGVGEVVLGDLRGFLQT